MKVSKWVASYYSEMAGLIVTKFGVWLDTMKRCISHKSWMACNRTWAREHVQMFPSISFPGKGGTYCAEIWYVVRDQLGRRFILLRGGVHLQVRTCAPLFRILGTAGWIALKFSMLLDTN